LDSGALYRVTALAALKRDVPLTDAPRLAELARHLNVHFAEHQQTGVIMLDDEDVSLAIRSERCGAAASEVAALEPVRTALLQRQRDFRRLPGLVADGRDMGTVVFTDASVKIFLTATPEERADRRYKQLKEKGISASLATLTKEIAERDKRDAERPLAPLKAAADAVILDSSGLTIEEVEQHALIVVNRKLSIENCQLKTANRKLNMNR
jgi:cytidylate kinase